MTAFAKRRIWALAFRLLICMILMICFVIEIRGSIESFKDINYITAKIGDVVGKQGKVINKIIEETGVKIDITDEGAVSVCGTDQAKMDEAIKMIEVITTDFAEGQKFVGKVVSIKEFGAFVEFAPGKEGMVHISKVANGLLSMSFLWRLG